MKEKSQNPSIDPELEARIVALVLGEVSDSERQTLDRLIEQRPELAKLRERFAEVHGLLCEIGTGDFVAQDDDDCDWKLSADKRSALLAVMDSQWKEPVPKPVVIALDQKRLGQGYAWLRNLTKIAAVLCVAGFLGIMAMSGFNSRQLARKASFTGGTSRKYLFENAPAAAAEGPNSDSAVTSSLAGIRDEVKAHVTLPDAYYLNDDVQDFPAGPENKLSGETSTLPDFSSGDRLNRELQERSTEATSPQSAPTNLSDGEEERFGRFDVDGLASSLDSKVTVPDDREILLLGGLRRFRSIQPGATDRWSDSSGKNGEFDGIDAMINVDEPAQPQNQAEFNVPELPAVELRTAGTPDIAEHALRQLTQGAERPSGEASLQGGTTLNFYDDRTESFKPAAGLGFDESLDRDMDGLVDGRARVSGGREEFETDEAQNSAINLAIKSQESAPGNLGLAHPTDAQKDKADSQANVSSGRQSNEKQVQDTQVYDLFSAVEPASPAAQLAKEPTVSLEASEQLGEVAGTSSEGKDTAKLSVTLPMVDDLATRELRLSRVQNWEVKENRQYLDEIQTGQAGQTAPGLSESLATIPQLQPSTPNVLFGNDAAGAGVKKSDQYWERSQLKQQEAAIAALENGEAVAAKGMTVAPTAPVNGSWMYNPRSKSIAPAGLNENNAANEAFSTFSLHVSDVSFKLAQTALARSEWPEAAKVRIEEFVNAFDYGDPLPSQNQEVACRVEQSIHPFLQQRNLLRVSMRTAAAGRSSNTPLRLTFLLDNSGSMERIDRQQTVRRAFAMLAQQLKPIDQVTLISFARQPRLLADRVSGAQSQQLIELIDDLPSEGGTNIEAALQLAFEKAKEQQLEGAQNRIVLLTDGAVNLGDADPESLSQRVTAIRDSGIAFDAAGINAEGLNDEILEALTRKGDGRYYLLDSLEAADDGFARQIAGALRPSAKNVKVQIEFNPKRVGHYKLLGFEKHLLKQEDFRNDRVDAAEMAAAEAGVAMYQFEAKPDGEGDVGSVSVRFQDLSTGQMVENRWPIPYEADAPRPEQAAPSLRIATSAALLAAKLRGEPLGEAVDLKTLSDLIAGLPDRDRNTTRVQQLQLMIQQARQLSGK